MADKWTIGGTIIAGIGIVVSVVAAVTVPEMRRCISLDPGGCPFLNAPISPPPQLESDVGIDYTPLRDLLAERSFYQANQETANVMLLASGRKEQGFLDDESIKAFPCKDLLMIDKLWAWSSNEKFSVAAQQEIWKEVKRDWDRFDAKITWENPSWSLQDRKGSFPRYPVRSSSGKNFSGHNYYVFDRFLACKSE